VLCDVRWGEVGGLVGAEEPYEGVTKNGRSMFAANEVMAKISNAKVPIRVASSHAFSISSGVRSGCAAK